MNAPATKVRLHDGLLSIVHVLLAVSLTAAALMRPANA